MMEHQRQDPGMGVLQQQDAQQQQDVPAVFIGNLQWWTSDVDLETECSKYGNVTNIRFIEDKSCGKSRGMAIVDFDGHDAVQACIAGMNGKELNGRPCKVNKQMAKYQQQQQQQQQQQFHGGGGRGMMMGRGRGRGMMMMGGEGMMQDGWGVMPAGGGFRPPPPPQ